MSTSTPSTSRPDRYPWIAMGVVLTGTFMVILDTTIVNVALPQIGIELRSTDGIEWVVTAYLLAVGIVQLATGWVSDRFGKKATYTASLALFTIGSLLAAASPNLTLLVVFRVFQGLGGGAMMPVGMAMIYELFPPDRRGTAIGIWGIAAMVAPAIGPVLGGWIATDVSWRWVFAVNIPIGVVGTILAVVLLRDVGYREERPLDRTSLAIAAAGLTALLIAFAQVSDWGWGSLRFVGLLTAGIVALGAFVMRELGSEHPLLEMRMFKIDTFSTTIAIVWLITMAQYARLVFMPLDLQIVHGLTPFQAGLLLAPAAVGAAITMPLGGRMTDRIGARIPVVSGLAMIAGSTWMLGHLGPTSGLVMIVVVFIVHGLGTGLAMMPNTVAAMNSLPTNYVSRGSAVRSLNRQIAASLGVAAMASVVSARVGTVGGGPGVSPDALQGAYNAAFMVAFVGVAVAAVLALRLPGRARTLEVQAERAQEYAELETA